MKPKRIRRYYRHLADQEWRRATRARLQARNEDDMRRGRMLMIIGETHEAQAKLYDRLHDEVK